jgi:tRNA G10  N-methylase Trm11
LRQELKEGSSKHALLYYLSDKVDVLPSLLQHEDAKVRKNTVLVMGELGNPEYLEVIFAAYEKETQLFVRSAYLTALKEFDYRAYLPRIKEQLNSLSEVVITEENKKHMNEEMRVLTDLIVTMEGIRKHKFTGYHVKSNLILLTNRNHIDVTIDQLKDTKATATGFNAGVMVKTEDINEVLPIRTYHELLFVLDGMKTCKSDPIQAANTIFKAGIVKFIEDRHDGKAPYYFRVELKSKMELDKKSTFTKKFASELEQLSKRQLINSTTNYEFEVRLIENKEGNLNILLKLYTLPDERFAYRKNSIATSIKPVNAALTVALTKEYMKEDAQVLDPFCGVGTMLIERHKQVKAYSTYGTDILKDAIEKARENTEEAHQIIHYINRDFFDFEHEYLFDEIITNMPAAIGHMKEEEIFELYRHFFMKAGKHLKEDGVIILYSHSKEFVQKLAGKNGFRIVKEFEISRKEGSYVYVITR